MASIVWDADPAEVYDETYAAIEEPAVLDPIVDFLANLANGGPVLEFAVGTGRVALPLVTRGIATHGLELSPGDTARVFTLEPDHVGIDTFDDHVGQIAWSQHWMFVGDRLVRHSAPYRYISSR